MSVMHRELAKDSGTRISLMVEWEVVVDRIRFHSRGRPQLMLELQLEDYLWIIALMLLLPAGLFQVDKRKSVQ